MMESRITGIYFEVDGASFEGAYQAEMASIQALYDGGPSTWCDNAPPVSADDALADSFYSAYARYEAERQAGK